MPRAGEAGDHEAEPAETGGDAASNTVVGLVICNNWFMCGQEGNMSNDPLTDGEKSPASDTGPSILWNSIALIRGKISAAWGICQKAARWLWISAPRLLFRLLRYVFQNFYSLLAKVSWIAAVIFISAILIHGLTEHVTVIDALSVPKELVERGITPEVAGRRLRDALVKFVDKANTSMERPGIALQGELPNIVVPSVGISLDAVLTSIRTLLRSTRSRTIAGELISNHDRLRLRLRLDGHEIYSNKDGEKSNELDELFDNAAPEILKMIKPYFVAASFYEDRPGESLAVANWIISQLPESDENVVWSYNLKGGLLLKMDNGPGAADAFRAAIRINRDFAAPHMNLGNILDDQNDHKGAIKEYRTAIRLQPKYALAHYNLAVALKMDKQTTAAILEFKEAIKANPKYAPAHHDLADVLKELGDTDAANLEYSEAAKTDPKYAVADNSSEIALNFLGHGKSLHFFGDGSGK
jgi:tetratricopeptide (TPR) repeat protein